jgi:hypothetical protein
MATVKTHTLREFQDEVRPLQQLEKESLNEAINIEMETHNALMNDATSFFVEQTTLEIEEAASQRTGAKLVRVDDIGSPVTIGFTSTPSRVGYPLEGYGEALGWTAQWFKRATTLDLATKIGEIELADLNMMRYLIADAIYSNSSVLNYRSGWMRQNNATSIDVRRFWNADGQFVPNSWKGQSFPIGHQHYLAANGVVGAALATIVDSLILTVEEHTTENQTVLFTNNADNAKIKALPGFIEALPPAIIESANARRIDLTLNMSQTDNRAIGYYNGRQVWEKPWTVPGYIVCLNLGGDKPIKQRNPVTGDSGLQILETNIGFKLQAEDWQRVTGFGTFNRSGGAVLDLVNAAYTRPALTVS